jgi:hypothetical protein
MKIPKPTSCKLPSIKDERITVALNSGRAVSLRVKSFGILITAMPLLATHHQNSPEIESSSMRMPRNPDLLLTSVLATWQFLAPEGKAMILTNSVDRLRIDLDRDVDKEMAIKALR